MPPVGALIGLNATLPSSLTQNLMTQNLMTERGVTGQRKPAAISAGDARGSDRLGHVLDLVLEVAVGELPPALAQALDHEDAVRVALARIEQRRHRRLRPLRRRFMSRPALRRQMGRLHRNGRT